MNPDPLLDPNVKFIGLGASLASSVWPTRKPEKQPRVSPDPP